jgi:outer membrane receptor protein involved in Fe transport
MSLSRRFRPVQFLPADLTYIDATSIPTDHSQLLTESAGVSYLWRGTRFGTDMLFGTGTRLTPPGGTPNGASLPSYVQFNFDISHSFELPQIGAFKPRFDVINLFNEIYLMRSSTSIGAFAPAYGPGRTFFAGITKEF